MKIKVTHVGSSSLLGSYVIYRIERGDKTFEDKSEEIEFYFGELMKDIDLLQEIDSFHNIYPFTKIKMFNLKYYEN